MKRTTRQAVDVLGGLLTERRKYEQWIAALEAKKDSTPAAVYERVHGDYSARLQNVLAELTARSAELDVQREALETRVAELEREEQARREERAEAEVRHTVGEYSPDQWNQFVRDNDTALGKAGAERARIVAELESLERILSGIGVAGDELEEEEDDDAEQPPAGTSRPKTGESRTVSNRAPAKSRESFDELAFLKSVVPEGEKAASVKKDDEEAEGTPASRGKTRENAAVKDAGRKPTPAGSRTPPVSTPAIPTSSRIELTGGGPKDSLPERSSRGSGSTELTAGVDNLAEPSPEAPAFLQDVPQEATKSLKCVECGTMNYATEWYCERCGAELAAL